MKKAIDQIKHLTPCMGAVVWLGGRTVEEMIQECPRGDWLLWLAAHAGIGLRRLTLAKGLCAKTVIHLMEDKRSRDAVKAAIAYGRYKIGDEEPATAASAAYTADHAEVAADHAEVAAYAAEVAAYDAREKNRLETADICRKVFGQQLTNAINKYDANN